MALVLPDSGERELLDDWLGARDRTLRLFSNDVTPAESDTLATYTEATFTGYAAKALLGATWNAASTSSGTTSATYAQQSWSPETAQTIVGYFVENDDATTLTIAERFASSRDLESGDTFYLTPRVEAA